MQEIMMGVGGADAPGSGVWTQLNNFPYGTVRVHATALLDDELYVFGGNLNNSATNRTFKLHIPTDTWSEVVTTNTPTARTASSLVAIDGLLYMYGGDVSSSQCWCLNPTTRAWTQCTAGINSYYHRAVTYQGKMVVVGGAGPTAAQVVRIYDPVANSWSFGSPFSSVIYGQGMDLFGDEIWLYGGYTTGVSATVWSYNLATKTWVNRGTNTPARQYHTFTNLNGTGYSYGGYLDPGEDRFKALSLPSTWTQLADAPPNRHVHTATAWQGKMIVVGGYKTATGSTNEVWLYNPG